MSGYKICCKFACAAHSSLLQLHRLLQPIHMYSSYPQITCSGNGNALHALFLSAQCRQPHGMHHFEVLLVTLKLNYLHLTLPSHTEVSDLPGNPKSSQPPANAKLKFTFSLTRWLGNTHRIPSNQWLPGGWKPVWLRLKHTHTHVNLNETTVKNA